MEKYLISKKSLETPHNLIFCVDDYGIEGELHNRKWYEFLEESNSTFKLINEWSEIETYSKSRFRIRKDNLPNE